MDAVNLLHAANFLNDIGELNPIKEIYLKNNSFNGPAFETVAILIQNNEYLRVLDLSYCKWVIF